MSDAPVGRSDATHVVVLRGEEGKGCERKKVVSCRTALYQRCIWSPLKSSHWVGGRIVA